MKPLEGKRLLVTGGTGSFGKVFVRRVLTGEWGTPQKVIVFSRDEAKQHDMRMAYLHKMVATDEVIYRNFMNVLEFRIGDIRDFGDVCSVLRDADIVVNAAALKQVPACEYFPQQALLTNCLGAANIVRAIEEHRMPIETVVGISTDKACKPVNAMGISKALQERILISANILNRHTRFFCVRYGNVLASRGSVIPLFHDQIRNGGPVTVTVPEMTRFLLSLDRAVDTVVAGLQGANRGETFVPNAPASHMIDVARALVGDRKVAITTTGIRPGEKMHEIMVSDEEAVRTVRRGPYYVIRPMLPELAHVSDDDPKPLTREFSSVHNALDLKGTIELLKAHRLMVEDRALFDGDEFLR